VIRGIEHIGIVVNDLDASIKFYCETLGLELEGVHELPGVKLAFVKAGNDTIELLKYSDRCCSEHEGTISHIALRVTDIERMVDKLKEVEGVELLSEEPKEVFGGSKIFFVKGINGEKIELFQKG
jgi:lactoylglutathione lyase